MPHIVDEARVNQFLPSEKLEIPTDTLHSTYNGQELENTIWGIVRAKLAAFDIANWVNASGTPVPSNVPKLILDIMGMWIAGTIYNKQFSEEASDTGTSYGTMLKNDAMALLDSIVEGTIAIDSIVVTDEHVSLGSPSVLETEPMFSLGTQF